MWALCSLEAIEALLTPISHAKVTNFPRVYFSEVIYLGLCTQVDHARDAVSECACSTWVLHHTHACGNVDGGVMLVPKLG